MHGTASSDSGLCQLLLQTFWLGVTRKTQVQVMTLMMTPFFVKGSMWAGSQHRGSDPGKPKWRPANNLPCFEVTKRILQNKVSCITCQVSVRYGKHWHGVSCSADQESPIHCYSICSIMFYVALSFKQQFGAVVFCFLFFAFVWQSRSCECRLTIKINIRSLIAKVCSKTRDYMLSL